MDILSICPQDHKNLIYRFLDHRDLIQIGLVSKMFYSDSQRRKELVEKLVDDYLYCSIYESPLLLSEYFDTSRYYQELVNEFFGRIVNISFTDLQHSSSTNEILIQKKHSISRFSYHNDIRDFAVVVPFYFFSDAFCKQHYQTQVLFLERVFSYLLDLWRCANKSKKCLYFFEPYGQIDNFQFSRLFLSMNQILVDLFIKNSNLREIICSKFNDLTTVTSASYDWYILETILDESEESGHFTYYANDYDMNHFIRSFKLCPTEIEKICDIGLFFINAKIDPDDRIRFISTFIAETFDEFVDDGVTPTTPNPQLDSYSEIIHEKLQLKFQDQTYDQILDKLFVISNFNYQQFKNALHHRLTRWNDKSNNVC